ncbi:hypothetical protein A6S26_28960 [Nostoc sp. ATCC 43529]|nr:hypothetical protein A6S26_28960 [Nostoc sp. ATCC 43529]
MAESDNPVQPQSQRERWQKERDSLAEAYELQRKKVAELRKASVIETDVSRKFQYEQNLQSAESELKKLDDDLNSIEQKLNSPSIYNYTNISPPGFIFPDKYWETLVDIISQIDPDIRTQACNSTLKDITQDVRGSYPKIEELKKISILKKIFLKDYPFNNKDIPTIIEFAQRLSKYEEVDKSYRYELKEWIECVTRELNIELPNCDESKLAGTAQSYLLIIVIPQGNDKFNLKSELICNFTNINDSPKHINLELESGISASKCSWNEIIDKIYSFIKISRNHLRDYEDYNLTIELFLPLPYLDKSIDLEEIPIGFGEKRAIANEYQFVIRSLERISEQDGHYLSLLHRRWKILTQFLDKKPTLKNFYEKIEQIPPKEKSCYSNFTWETCNLKEFENNWDIKKSLGIQVTCDLPIDKEAKRKFFIALIRSGVPMSLWTRCSAIPNLETEFNEIFIDETEIIADLNNLCESIWKLRRKAHAKQDEDKQNYLGYHLGFICDHPYRIPFSLTNENQRLLEPGQ